MRNRLLDIFNNLSDESSNQLNLHQHSRVLLVDGMNTFLRSFAAINHHNLEGQHVGGLTGFLKSIGAAVKQLSPTKVVVVFDGEGGSVNRKYLYPEYKGNRVGNNKVTNFKSFRTKQEEDRAKMNEITRLIDYLKLLPISLICIDRLEADDIIGHLATTIYKNHLDSEIWIMSTDNDFLQLVNDRIRVYSPTKKKHYYAPDVLEEFGVHPENFILFKALTGDSSDNIPGVHGIGEKNVYKLFEELQLPERRNLSYIFETCRNKPKNSVLYDRVLEMDKMVEIFYQIVNLREPNISDDDKDDIRRMYYAPVGKLQKYEFAKLYESDRMGDTIPFVNTWIDCFTPLNNWIND